jgi:hypothetical protein
LSEFTSIGSSAPARISSITRSTLAAFDLIRFFFGSLTSGQNVYKLVAFIREEVVHHGPILAIGRLGFDEPNPHEANVFQFPDIRTAFATCPVFAVQMRPHTPCEFTWSQAGIIGQDTQRPRHLVLPVVVTAFVDDDLESHTL